MSDRVYSRRNFMNTMILGTGAVTGLTLGSMGMSCSSGSKKAYGFDIGSFPRPWGNKTPMERALDGIKAAGFKNVGLMVEREPDQVTRPTLREDYEKVQKLLQARGLKPIMAMWRPDLSKKPSEAAKMLVPLMDILKEMKIKYILDLATWEEDHYDDYYDVLKACADEAEKRGQQIVVKPHIGKWETGESLAEACEAINSKAYRICYDPGNILFYSHRREGKARDTIKELKVCIDWVTALIVKDWKQEGLERPTARISPGTGESNFPEIFRLLKEAKFNGPCVVELMAGTTPEEVDQDALKTYNYLKELSA